MDTKRVLWTCPRCGKKFVGKNMAHSCVRRTVADFFSDKDPEAKKIFSAFLKCARKNGSVIADVAKTRIAFQARTRFAALDGVKKQGVLFHIWLKRKIKSPRFVKTELYHQRDYVYYFYISKPAQVDAEVAYWLKEAYRVGMQDF